MILGKPNNSPLEEYELLEQNPPEPSSSQPESVSTPSINSEANSETRNSSESQSSELFDEIDEFAQKSGAEADDFASNPQFQHVLTRYKGSDVFIKRACLGIAIFSVVLWVVSVLIYSHSSFASTIKSITWQTDVEVSGKNITLNSYSPKFANVTMDSYRKGHFSAYRESIHWLTPAQYPKRDSSGGYYLSEDLTKSYVVKQIDSDYSEVFIKSTQFSYRNDFFYIDKVKLNPAKRIDDFDKNFHIIVTDTLEQWRSSSFALYWLFNPVTAQFVPIQPPNNRDKLHNDEPQQEEVLDKLHFADFSPNGDYILFGFNHDLYIQNLANDEIHKITDSGSPSIFNGKPDWVYEEEVVADYKMYWWSPDQKNLLFVTLNDTDVQDFELDYYIKDRTEIGTQYKESDREKVKNVNQYPIKTTIKYPKPGTSNPLLTLNNYRLEDKSTTKIEGVKDGLGEDFIMYSGIWVDNKNFLMKLTDRTSSILSKKKFQPEVSPSRVEEVSKMNVTEAYGGWVEKLTPITVIPRDDRDENSYVDKVVVNGRLQLALYDSVSSKEYTKVLTKADTWDVKTMSPVIYNSQHKVLYFLSTIRSSMDSHLGAVSLEEGEKYFPITSTAIDGVYEVDFSSDGQYASLFYKGPDQPWQRLVNMAEVHDFISSDAYKEGADTILQKSPSINHFEVTSSNLKDTNIPTKVFKKISIGKYSDKSSARANVIEIFPPNFDPYRQKKYPLLVYAYGGPGSQTVDKSFDIDFQHVVSASLDALVLVIDPRGTGGQGWEFSSFAKNKLGYWEPRDISTITSEYISVNKKFIDSTKTALWGWSYGGFTTLKTLEYDAGHTFKFGMAVAPVTNWLFYDSVYTERYMGSPNSNDNYEEHAKIKDYNKYKALKRFLIMHGTSDDNVHLQNSLWLLDKLNLANVENYDVHFFPDSDHAIHYHNADSIVFDKLLRWLRDAFNGKFDERF
ncbi:dipeptidyl peptidase IV N-terminal region-domain-containing protein [Scheffersomyces xylosifermentans]|uniref:dipeptidyl peptidase IV N-terminal region-domain-containing protein n=1 Tax=Scheffersomyces xylosifermentans TaxID=1304137 RepID=UPI00315D3061